MKFKIVTRKNKPFQDKLGVWIVHAYDLNYLSIPKSDNVIPYCLSKMQEYKLTYYKETNTHIFYRIPYEYKKGWKLISGIEGIKITSGEIEIVFRHQDTNQVVYDEKIQIIPSLFDIEDFYKMVTEIGFLSINHLSFTKSNRNILLSKEMSSSNLKNSRIVTKYKNIYTDSPIIQELEIFIDMVDKFLKSNILSSNNIIAKKTIFPIYKSNIPQNLIQRKINPAKKMALGKIKSYHHDSYENQWLKYILNIELEAYIKCYISINNYKNNLSYNSEISSNKNSQLENILSKLKSIQSHHFFTEVSTKSTAPNITTKLLKTNGYSQIYSCYNKIFTDKISESFKLCDKIEKFYGKSYLGNLSNIYEIWCLVTIITSLEEIGFSGGSLDDYIQFDEEQIKLKDNTKIILSKKFSANEIKCCISYEPKIDREKTNLNPYTPDILIHFSAPTRKYGLEEFTIILDAKQKKFFDLPCTRERLTPTKEQGNNDVINEIFMTAMGKYHNELKIKPNASYILHPNDSIWSGEEPLIDYLTKRHKIEPSFTNDIFEKFNLKKEYRGYISHKFAALPLRPKNISLNIRHLFTLIFHYHMGLTSLCLGCGRELCGTNEFYVNNNDDKTSPITKSKENKFQWNNSDPSTCFRAVCKNCQNEWRISFCNNAQSSHGHQPNKKNRIVKIGKLDNNQINWFSIHKRDEQGDTGCPTCGKIFNSSQSNNSNHFSSENNLPF